MKLFKAFTLVELLVVMAIISFLSVGAFAGLSFGLRQARDVQKKKVVDLAHTAMQAYYSDYAAYPKCANNAASTTVPGLSGWGFCPNAFPNTTVGSGYLITTGGKAGIKDYLEGEWPSTNSNAQAGTGDVFLRYYINSGSGATLKFAVCTTVENTTAASNILRKDGTKKKDCYCAGTEYSEVACAGMLGRGEQ